MWISDEKSLEGWTPELGNGLTLAQVIEFAFDYRGNVTLVKGDGAEVVCYVFNRNADAPEPFLEYFDAAGNGPFSLPYAQVKNIRFTGRDMAAGRSYQAWLKRKQEGLPPLEPEPLAD